MVMSVSSPGSCSISSRTRPLTAGPWRSRPSKVKREPWQGQTSSPPSTPAMVQPRWGQRAECAVTSPPRRRRMIGPWKTTPSALGRGSRCVLDPSASARRRATRCHSTASGASRSRRSLLSTVRRVDISTTTAPDHGGTPLRQGVTSRTASEGRVARTTSWAPSSDPPSRSKPPPPSTWAARPRRSCSFPQALRDPRHPRRDTLAGG